MQARHWSGRILSRRTQSLDHYVISQRQFYLRCDQYEKPSPSLSTMCCVKSTTKGHAGQLAGATGINKLGSHQSRTPVTYLRTIRNPPPPVIQNNGPSPTVLGTLDDKIELNRRMNETLEEMTRALFKSWFVDFDPVRAKIDGRWRRGESLPGLPAEHYDLFPDRLVPVGTRGNTGGVGSEGVGGLLQLDDGTVTTWEHL